MRRIVAFFLFLFFFATSAIAAEIYSEYAQRFTINDPPTVLFPITIKAANESELTAQKGIRILIPADLYTTWDRSLTSVELEGSAVDNGRVGETASVDYPTDDLKIVHIPVKEDFRAGEQVTINGLMMRVYDRDNGWRYLKLDLDADGVADESESTVSDVNGIRISTSSPRVDTTAPYNPTDLRLVQTANNAISINWVNPPDLDLREIEIIRERVRDGVSKVSTYEAYSDWTVAAKPGQYNDLDVQPGDGVTYTLRARDSRNASSGISISIEVVDVTESTVGNVIYCTEDYNPVCGADGQTYTNSCYAEKAAISEFTDGECGNSLPGQTVCTADYNPVCADGSTFSNACHAEAAGHTTYSLGECENPTIPQTEEEILLETRADAAGVTITEVETTAGNFSDLSTTDWSVAFITKMTNDGVLAGYPDGTIRPNVTINRAEFAKMVSLALSLSSRVAESDFSDVPADSWFAPFVHSLYEAGASWTAGSEYLPSDGVSRGEAMWVIATAAGASLDEVLTVAPFPDVPKTHVYAPAIAWAKENGILSGYEKGNFGPNDTLTRGQVAKILTLTEEAQK